MMNCKAPRNKEERANRIQIKTNYSSDGRSLESVFIDYDDTYPVFLLLRCLRNNPEVVSVTVWDENGNVDERYSFNNKS